MLRDGDLPGLYGQPGVVKSFERTMGWTCSSYGNDKGQHSPVANLQIRATEG